MGLVCIVGELVPTSTSRYVLCDISLIKSTLYRSFLLFVYAAQSVNLDNCVPVANQILYSKIAPGTVTN